MSANPIRDLAWRTRRARYGEHGHAGSYSRSSGECRHCRRMADVLIRLLNEAVLSEGQVAKATGWDRVAVRKRADELRGIAL